MKKVLFTLALAAFGLIAGAQGKPAPVLAFGTDANNLITEVELAPGENTEVQVILVEQQEAVVMGFQMQWKMYDANHELTEAVTCPDIIPDDPDFPMGYSWALAMNLSTASAAQGGVPGNALGFAYPEPATWRWVGTNTSRNQFWWPRQSFVPPIAVGKIAIQVPADWAEEYATFELDKEYTLFNQTPETTPASQQNYEVQPADDMILKIKNSAYVAPQEDVPLTGEIILGEVDAENGLLPVSYTGDEEGLTIIAFPVNREVRDSGNSAGASYGCDAFVF